jgi:chromosome segregation ATPase
VGFHGSSIAMPLSEHGSRGLKAWQAWGMSSLSKESNPNEKSILNATSVSAAVNEELERYRNRASLVEAVLKGKVAELEVQHAKLEVLLDVVKKLRVKADGAAEWKAKYEEVQIEWAEARKSLELMQRDWDKTTKLLESERNGYQIDLATIKEEIDIEKKRGEEYQRSRMETDKRVALVMDKLKNEKASMRNKIISLEDESATLRKERDAAEAAASRKQDKVLRLKDELVKVNQELDLALGKADVKEQGRRDFDEAMEIAKAAVAAAERREAAMRTKYEDLKSQLDKQKDQPIRPEEEELRREIEGLTEQIRSLNLELRSGRRESEKRIAEVSEKYHKHLQRARKEFLTSKVEQPAPTQGSGVWQRIRTRFRK